MDEIHYPAFYKLNIPYDIIKKDAGQSALSVFSQFYAVCKKYKPNLIHTWGRIQSLYALPAVIFQRIPLVNSQITSAPPPSSRGFLNAMVDHINFNFSKVILSNSRAGIVAYTPPAEKRKVIYNGINLNRFHNLPDTCTVKSKYGISTPYAVIMSASFSPNKDYDLFYNVASRVTTIRNDVTFIGIGVSHDERKFRALQSLAHANNRILFPGRIDDVEALVNACDIGVLFSNRNVHGEGISNSIMEYMALSKPVIANDAGGTKEIVHHNKNGYLIKDHTEEEIVKLILELLDDKDKAKAFGEASREIIEESFSLERMGDAFEQVYLEALK